MKIMPRHLPVALMLMVLLLGVGTGGYMILEGASARDAFYMTVITISTVGYDETVPVRSPATMWLTTGLIFVGIGLFFWIVSEMAQFTVRQQIQETLGRRSVQKTLDALREHYIVCGYGRMGQAIAAYLRERQQSVVVVEPMAEKQAMLQESGLPFVIGDATDEAVLQQVGIARARGLVAAAGSDPVNVYVTLTARAIAPELLIVARADDERAESKLRTAGANRVVSVYTLGAQRVANTLLRPAVVNLMDLAIQGGPDTMQIEQLEVQARCELDGSSARECQLRSRFGVIVIAVESPDGSIRFNPADELRFAAGDVLVVLGTASNLEQLSTALAAPAQRDADA